jgi:hypothetical protein
MELAANWHRCQNLQKNECILPSAVYKGRDDPVKKVLANRSWDRGLVSSLLSRVTGVRFAERHISSSFLNLMPMARK